jgi:capsular exopolysaccharide synthesis family protein
MSRIFDALRKSEKDRAEQSGAAAARQPESWREMASAAQAGGDALPRVPAIRCASANGHRPAATWHQTGQETFRVLHHRLEQLRRRRPLRKLLVSSAIPQEGKTTIAVNLAVVLARASRRVLLIDADLRHPGVHRALGLPAQAGLGDWLEGRSDRDEALRRVEPYGFYYLPAGEAQSNPGEILRQAPLEEFLTATAGSYDWVVIDSPPLAPFVDAHHLATLVDGVLLVLRRGVTPRSALEQAVTSLDRAYVAGVVVNGTGDGNHRYYRYYDREPASSANPESAGETEPPGVSAGPAEA